MTASAESSDPPTHRRASIALVIIGSFILFFGGFAVWAARQLLKTDDWVETSTELLEDQDIQQAVSTFMVDSLFSAVDVKGELEQALPPQLQPLAGPAAGGIRELAGRVSLRALESPKFQQLWAEANRAAHEEFVAIVEDQDPTDGTVSLDLSTLIAGVGDQVGIDVADKVPESIGSVEILQSDEISAVQDAVDLLQKLAYGLIIAALLLYAIAIWLARGRRREIVRAIGFGWIVVGVAIVAVRELAGNAIVDQLASTASVEPAVEATWSIGTSLLYASAVALIGYGVVAVIGAWLAGPTGLATAFRRGLAPLFNSPLAAYVVFLILVLMIFFVWAPTEGTQRLLPSLVLTILLIAGFEALRRRTAADFPDENWEASARRWRARLTRRGAEKPGD